MKKKLFKSSCAHHGYRRNMELLICVLVIAILACLALGEYVPTVLHAKIIHFSGNREKTESMHCYYAVNGMWPDSDHQAGLMSYYWGEKDDAGFIRNDMNQYIEQVKILNGSVDYIFGRDLSGKTLTLRPAVPKGYPDGPVIWVCGSEQRELLWDISGEDRTDVGSELINRFLR